MASVDNASSGATNDPVPRRALGRTGQAVTLFGLGGPGHITTGFDLRRSE